MAVFAAYCAEAGQALVDVELYLPRAFAEDAERCRVAGVPAERAGTVVTKGELAAVMLTRAIEAGIRFGFVAGDEVYGRSPALRQAIEAAGRGYVLGVGVDRIVHRNSQDKTTAAAAKGTSCPRRPGSGRPPRPGRRACASTPGPGSRWTPTAVPTAGPAAC